MVGCEASDFWGMVPRRWVALRGKQRQALLGGGMIQERCKKQRISKKVLPCGAGANTRKACLLAKCFKWS